MEALQQKNEQRCSDKWKEVDNIFVSPTDSDAVLGCDKEKAPHPPYRPRVSNGLQMPLVLAYDLCAQPSDSGTLKPMAQRFVELNGHKPTTTLSDSRYADPADLEFCYTRGIDLIARGSSTVLLNN